MGLRFVPKSVTLNDLERHNDRRPALSLWQLIFLSVMTQPTIVAAGEAAARQAPPARPLFGGLFKRSESPEAQQTEEGEGGDQEEEEDDDDDDE